MSTPTTYGVGARRLATYLAANYTAGTLLGTPHCWLRADTTTNSGGFVDQWTDKSGNARHFTQTLTKRPTLVASGSDPNGFACITPDGVSTCLTNAGFGAMSAITVYMVTRSIVTPAATAFLLSIGNGADAQSVQYRVINSGTNQVLYNNPGNTVSNWSFGTSETASFGTSAVRVTSMSGTTANGGATVWNGRARLGSVGSVTSTASTGSTIANLAACIGANKTGAASFLQFGIYEMVVFNAAHTSEQQANMELLLARYYALV